MFSLQFSKTFSTAIVCVCYPSSKNLMSRTETQVGGFLTKFPNSFHFGPLHKKLEFPSPVCWLHFPQAALCALSQQSVVDLRETPVWLMALGTPHHGWERVGATLFCTAWLRKLCLLLWTGWNGFQDCIPVEGRNSFANYYFQRFSGIDIFYVFFWCFWGFGFVWSLVISGVVWAGFFLTLAFYPLTLSCLKMQSLT